MVRRDVHPRTEREVVSVSVPVGGIWQQWHALHKLSGIASPPVHNEVGGDDEELQLRAADHFATGRGGRGLIIGWSTHPKVGNIILYCTRSVAGKIN